MKRKEYLLLVALAVIAAHVFGVSAQETQQHEKTIVAKELRVVDKDGKTVTEFTILPSDDNSLWSTIYKDMLKSPVSYISALAAAFSAIMAGCAVYMNHRMHKLVMRMEPPALCIQESHCASNYVVSKDEKGDDRVCGIAILFSGTFKNAGRHAAENVRGQFSWFPLEDPSEFQTQAVTTTETVYQEALSMWSQEMRVPAKSSESANTMEVLIYVRLDYHDSLQPSAGYFSEFHFVYSKESNFARYATVEEREIYERHAKNACRD